MGRLDKAEKKRKEKERSSVYIDRSNSETAKDRAFYEKKYGKNHKRQRSWAGNKLLDVEGGGGGGVGEVVSESCEFQVLSSDNKTWSFEAPSPEVCWNYSACSNCYKYCIGNFRTPEAIQNIMVTSFLHLNILLPYTCVLVIQNIVVLVTGDFPTPEAIQNIPSSVVPLVACM